MVRIVFDARNLSGFTLKFTEFSIMSLLSLKEAIGDKHRLMNSLKSAVDEKDSAVRSMTTWMQINFDQIFLHETHRQERCIKSSLSTCLDSSHHAQIEFSLWDSFDTVTRIHNVPPDLICIIRCEVLMTIT